MSGKARTPHSQALPNYERAVIPRSKLEGYALNPAHKDGQHKARLFKSILGFERTDWQELEKVILDELPYHEAVLSRVDKWGEFYSVSLPVVGPNGKTAVVQTIWKIETGTDFPSFVTPRTIKEVR
jgi:filamentous hemagglutinin